MDFREEILEGSIPIEFTCLSHQVGTSPSPKPYYILASRYSYLPIITRDYIEDLKLKYIIDMEESSSDVWYESEGYKLKPNWPIGVLFDSYQPQATASTLPWKVIICFGPYPSELLVKCQNSEESERYYNQTLKQSLYLLYGNSHVYNSLSGEKQKQLWESVCTVEFTIRIYQSVAMELFPQRIEDMKCIPIRILRQTDHMFIQKPIRAELRYSMKKCVEYVMGLDLSELGWWVMTQGIEVRYDLPVQAILRLCLT